MRDVLRHAAGMLGELRTGELQPTKYFELYMMVSEACGLISCCACVSLSRAPAPSALHPIPSPRLLRSCTRFCNA